MSAPATYAPSPGAAPLRRMLRAQTGLEIRMVLRNGEQLLLTIVIPVLVLVVFGSLELTDLGDPEARLAFLVPGVLALAVLSTAFTGLAIGTGFERRYGALKRLGASPLPRAALLAAKAMAVLRARLLEMEQQRQAEERGEQRRSQVGTGERSEKIRTYNYPDDRVTDHRIGLTVHNLPGLLQGDMDRLIDPLAEADQAARLAAVGAAEDG